MESSNHELNELSIAESNNDDVLSLNSEIDNQLSKENLHPNSMLVKREPKAVVDYSDIQARLPSKAHWASPMQRMRPVQSMAVDPREIYELIARTDKNPIALLHEYCSKIKKGVYYTYSLKGWNAKKASIFQCQISIDGIGVIAHGTGITKKAAKNYAGLNALYKLVNSDTKARAIVGSLLQRQAVKGVPGGPRDSIGHQRGAAFPPPPSCSISVSEILKNEENSLARLSFFANSLSFNMKWRYRTERGICIAECFIGHLKASGAFKQKKIAKVIAGKNMLKKIDSDPVMKQKFITFLKTDKTKKNDSTNQTICISDGKTNLLILKKRKKKIIPFIDRPRLQIQMAHSLTYNEPEDIVVALNSINEKVSASLDQGFRLRELYEQVKNFLGRIYEGHHVEFIPVGSLLLDCVRLQKLEFEAFLHLENNGLEMNVNELKESMEQYAKELGPTRLEELIGGKVTFQIGIGEENDEHVLIRQQKDKDTFSMRLYLVKLPKGEAENETKPLNRYTVGIYHSNWLVNNFSQSQNSNLVVKLLRLLREWRDRSSLSCLPTEIIDLALKYSSFNFQEVGFFKVMLKFFTILPLVLNRQKQFFFDLSEYHLFLTDRISESDTELIIKKCQDTLQHLTEKKTIDFGDEIQKAN